MNATATQPELPFARVESDDPRIARLIGLLDRCDDWITAGEIEQRLRHMTGMAQFSDRLVRALASASEGIITGSARGYRLTKYLTEGEMEHACNRLRSQAGVEIRRADQIENVWRRAQKATKL